MAVLTTDWIAVSDNEVTVVEAPLGVLTGVRVRWMGRSRTETSTTTTTQAYGDTFYGSVVGYMDAPTGTGTLVRVSASMSVSLPYSESWSIGLTPSGGSTESNGGTGTGGSVSATSYSPTAPRAHVAIAVGIELDPCSYSGSVTAYWQTSTTYQTISPQITVDGNVTAHSGTLNNGVVSAWYSASGFVSGSNSVRHDMTGSERAYIQYEFTYTPAMNVYQIEPAEFGRVARDDLYFVMRPSVEAGSGAAVWWPRLQLSRTADLSEVEYDLDATSSLTGWTYWDAALESWEALTAAGAPIGADCKYTPAATLPIARWYWRAKGIEDDTDVWGDWTGIWMVRLVLSVAARYALEIDGVDFSAYAQQIRVLETTNGELGRITFVLLVEDGYEVPADGMSVYLAVRDVGGEEEQYEGWMQGDGSRVGPQLYACVVKLPDSILAERYVREDYASADVGATFASMVTEYGSPLLTTGIDTTTGFTRPITAFGKTLLDIAQELREQYGLLFWVDSTTQVVYLVNPADLGAAEVRVARGQRG